MQKEEKRGASAPLFAIFRALPSRNQQQAVCANFAHTGLFLGVFTWGPRSGRGYSSHLNWILRPFSPQDDEDVLRASIPNAGHSHKGNRVAKWLEA